MILSKALFIFSYNDESKVNPILRDRMYRISTKGYSQLEKKTIANEYLLPYVCSQIIFKEDDILISNETLTHIIDKYTDKEDGVRNLKRCLEIIYTKLNLFRLMKPESTLFKDPLAQFQLQSKDFYEITKRTLELSKLYCNGKVVSILEGGYDLNALKESTTMHLNALLEFN